MTAIDPGSGAFAGATPKYPWKRASIAIGLAVFVAFLRRPAAFVNPQFWAEDGSVFFVQAEGLGIGALLFPHAGYLLLAMRLIAGIATGAGAPVLWLPALFVAGATIGWLLVASFLFSPRIRLRCPETMLAAMVLVPVDNETWFNLTNVQWVLALLWALWWLADDPRTKRGMILEWLSMAVVGLTGVFAVFAAPLMVWRAARRRTVASIVGAVITVATAATQLLVAHAAGAVSAGVAGSGAVWLAAPAMFAKRVWGGLWIPPSLGDGPMQWCGAGFAAFTLAGFALMVWRRRDARPLAGWAFLAFAAMAATLLRFGNDIGPLMGTVNGERYFHLPKMLLIWGVVQTGVLSTSGWRSTTRTLLVLALLAAAVRFQLPALRDNDWPSWAARVEAGGDVGWVPITPEGMRFYYAGPPER